MVFYIYFDIFKAYRKGYSPYVMIILHLIYEFEARSIALTGCAFVSVCFGVVKMVKLGLWRTGHCPSLFPLVSTPLITPGSDGRKGSVSWSAPASLQKNKPAKISSITSALRGIPGMNLVVRRCGKCRGKAAIECPGCKGTGKNKKNGNMFERWKCYDCEGFGLLSCPSCGKGGLTPVQRG